MHACIHKASEFIGGKGPKPLKKLLFCQTMVMLDYVCVQSFMITHKHCFMLIVKYKVICILCSQCLRLVAIYWLWLCYVATIMVILDYMCVQSFMITHTQCFMLIVKYKVICIITWGWLLLVTSMERCQDDDNIGLHVCAKFHDHTHD